MCVHNIFSQELWWYVAVDPEAWEMVRVPEPERHCHKAQNGARWKDLGHGSDSLRVSLS